MPTTSSKKTKGKTDHDCRNTLWMLYYDAVEKYNLSKAEVTLYGALYAGSKQGGFVQIGNSKLMRISVIGDKTTFKKARDRLIELGFIKIIKKGTAQKEYTTYWVKRMQKPNLTKHGGDWKRKKTGGENPPCTG